MGLIHSCLSIYLSIWLWLWAPSVLDTGSLPSSSRCDLHSQDLAQRDWLCSLLRCTHAENLEVPNYYAPLPPTFTINIAGYLSYSGWDLPRQSKLQTWISSRDLEPLSACSFSSSLFELWSHLLKVKELVVTVLLGSGSGSVWYCVVSFYYNFSDNRPDCGWSKGFPLWEQLVGSFLHNKWVLSQGCRELVIKLIRFYMKISVHYLVLTGSGNEKRTNKKK